MLSPPPVLERPFRREQRSAYGASWVSVAAVVAFASMLSLFGIWLRETGETSAAYKAYHRANVEFVLGRATRDRVCVASRRCCIAECGILLMSQSAACRRHLARIDALWQSDEVVAKDDDEVWRAYHDEAVLWLKYGKVR